MRGVANARCEAVCRMRLSGPTGIERSVDAIVDTGFTASTTLPVATVAALGLSRQSSGRAVLGDGATSRFEVYAAELNWDGSWRSVTVYAMGREVLLSMRILAEHRLRIDVVPGGAVEIAPLP